MRSFSTKGIKAKSFLTLSSSSNLSSRLKMDVPTEAMPTRAQSMSSLPQQLDVPESKAKPAALTSCRSEADMLSTSLPLPSFLDYFRRSSKNSSLAGSTESGFMSDDDGCSSPLDQDSMQGINITLPKVVLSNENVQKKQGFEEFLNKKSLLPPSIVDYFKKNTCLESTSPKGRTVTNKACEPTLNRIVRVNRRDLNSFAPTTL